MVLLNPVFDSFQFDNLRDSWDDAIKGVSRGGPDRSVRLRDARAFGKSLHYRNITPRRLAREDLVPTLWLFSTHDEPFEPRERLGASSSS
jgi:hypothetical protein